jgi:hypothetical protein
MKGRRTAAMLCVLLGHALVVLALLRLTREPSIRAPAEDVFVTQLITIVETHDDEALRVPDPRVELLPPPPLPEPSASSAGSSEAASGAVTGGYVDWPKEGRDAAARVLAREAEAERIAKMFAGPQGTWASLTRRQQSELKHFRWKPGIDGLERDEKGNTIYHLPNGCALVNFVFFGCPIGKKPPPYGDLFKDMRKYFDEQRLPQTQEGNGTEPESKRPPKWSKPLE